jgi:hypothetical protein
LYVNKGLSYKTRKYYSPPDGSSTTIVALTNGISWMLTISSPNNFKIIIIHHFPCYYLFYMFQLDGLPKQGMLNIVAILFFTSMNACCITTSYNLGEYVDLLFSRGNKLHGTNFRHI